MVRGYARVSSAGQKLDCQIEALMAYGCEVVYQEKESGANDDRPELNRLLADACEGDLVVVTKLDRIARSTQHLLHVVDTLTRKKAQFKALNADFDTTSPTGKLMLTLLGAIATFELELNHERQREGIERAKREGKYKGRKSGSLPWTDEIMELLTQGNSRAWVAGKMGISIATIYRVQRKAREEKA
jgi:DNA invertase Pin-like site-specific DNA recombinase